MTDTGPRYSQAGFAALTGRVVAPTMPNDDEVRHLAEQLVATTRELTAAREALALARYERDAIAQDFAAVAGRAETTTATTEDEHPAVVAIRDYLSSYTLPANYSRPCADESHRDVARRCAPLIAAHLDGLGLLATARTRPEVAS